MVNDAMASAVFLSVSVFTQNGCTALHMAAMKGHKDAVSQLIKDGADVNRTDGQGQ